jgi:hypothetical protein
MNKGVGQPAVEAILNTKNAWQRSLMQKASPFLRICTVLAAAGTAVLFVMPLSPSFPNSGLDSSWQ